MEEVTIEYESTISRLPCFEVTRRLPGAEPEITITDAAGVSALAEEAAASGTRIHVRPLDSNHPPTE